MAQVLHIFSCGDGTDLDSRCHSTRQCISPIRIYLYYFHLLPGDYSSYLLTKLPANPFYSVFFQGVAIFLIFIVFSEAVSWTYYD